MQQKKSAKKWLKPSSVHQLKVIDGTEDVVNGEEVEGTYEEVIAKIDDLQEKSKALDRQKKDCEKEIARLQAVIEANLEEENEFTIKLEKRKKNVGISFNEKFSESVPVAKIRDLKKLDKDLYDYLVGISFIKQKSAKDIKFFDRAK